MRILISILLLPFVQNVTQHTVPSSLLRSQHQPTMKKVPENIDLLHYRIFIVVYGYNETSSVLSARF